MSVYAKILIDNIKSLAKRIMQVTLIIAVVIAVVSLFLKSIYPHSTQNTNVSSFSIERQKIYRVLNDPKNTKTSVQRGTIAGMRVITCFFVGETCSTNPNDPKNNIKKGFVGKLSGVITLPLLNPPASGVYYVKNTLSHFGFIPSAYAAEGIGFSSLNPLFKVWRALRDISLMVIVVVIIFIGFLIMFRMKLNPQTVINIENSLPKIVITLIVITFSFAIVGFLIDLMYILMTVIMTALGPLANIPTDQLATKYLFAEPFDIFSLFADKGNTGGELIGNILFDLPNALMRAIPIVSDFAQIMGVIIGFWKIFPFLWTHLIGGTYGQLFNIDWTIPLIGVTLDGPIAAVLTRIFFTAILIPFSFSLAAFIVPILIGLLILLTVISLFFRILFMILRSYVMILFLTILSPLLLLIEAIPGQSSFSNWFRTLLSELITFPTLIAILLIGTIITESIGTNGFLTQFPFLYGINGNALSMIVGMMLLFLIPDLVKKVKTKIQPKPMGLENAGLGVFFGGAAAGVGAIGGGGAVKSLFMNKIGSSKLLPEALRSFFPSKKQENADLAAAIASAMPGAGGGAGGAGGGGGGGGGGAPAP
ncbi:hypothetical protein A2690_03285 [Candidatus Roizmanbacteria bacterium RIFCSPHIGHO2_01_FULL_39_12b]|uniref:Uncharacterized protein n=1 Tax=Candidatus Roizmanbacteria bacterium RIFCSPHIGHO2_01_FULL_39_12b TaxID=1802030 RepID=A0A1F7GDD2_9BACT|nr:MAG: hypothetical protein A2690_03285 [Candidatus Roizmanbacteria bacterium RIFCSPHIGHO2_01_FULL_39_12b]OGK46687.1 MAG: hypothetical protein A3B46_02535 [Candidatus Roizmanbacteria bacterium RIFCSPLOWO2_01_FULL_39_19]